ncbi:hypothetical protein MHTCC0001_29260 [Flavobacteriaceae bacterium MHTCC 0001]
MKVLFLCGSLEFGKDGVGDYTRRLSAELLRSGIQVGILAYKDGFVKSITETNQKEEGFSISCLRLPGTLPHKARINKCKAWIELKNPEWLSLQFVPYSFNYKGLPFGLGGHLKELGGDRKWHIMFHELWLGLRKTDSIKFKCIGFFQKQIVKSLQSKLKFEAVHTHTKFYMKELEKMNFKPKYLPIFSNIKFDSNSNKDEFKFDKETLVFAHFGTIHPNVPIQEFANELFLYSQSVINKRILLVLLGRSGLELGHWEEELKKNQIAYYVLGELPNEKVSHILQKATYGLTTNPVFVLEKSGTVAAMREHNLPILVVSENTSPRNGTEINLDNGFFKYKAGNLNRFINSGNSNLNVRAKGVNEVSLQFIKDLVLE